MNYEFFIRGSEAEQAEWKPGIYRKIIKNYVTMFTFQKPNSICEQIYSENVDSLTSRTTELLRLIWANMYEKISPSYLKLAHYKHFGIFYFSRNNKMFGRLTANFI